MLRYSTPCMRASWCFQSCQSKFCGLAAPEPRHCSCNAAHRERAHAARPLGLRRTCNTYFARGTIRCLHCVGHAQRKSCSALTLAEQLVLTGDTPVGQGLLSCQECQSGTVLLKVPLIEVVAITEPHLQSKPKIATLSAATATYSAMPKKLLQFVQGRPKHHTH